MHNVPNVALYVTCLVCVNEETGQEKRTIRSYAHKVADDDLDNVSYEANFDVPAGFGPIGAVLVTNEHRTEMFLEDVKITAAEGAGNSALLAIRCNSWVQPKSGDDDDEPVKRIFFANKVNKHYSAGSSRIRIH